MSGYQEKLLIERQTDRWTNVISKNPPLIGVPNSDQSRDSILTLIRAQIIYFKVSDTFPSVLPSETSYHYGVAITQNVNCGYVLEEVLRFTISPIKAKKKNLKFVGHTLLLDTNATV